MRAPQGSGGGAGGEEHRREEDMEWSERRKARGPRVSGVREGRGSLSGLEGFKKVLRPSWINGWSRIIQN